MQVGDIVTGSLTAAGKDEVGIVLALDPESGNMAFVYWSGWGDTMWHQTQNLRVINENR